MNPQRQSALLCLPTELLLIIFEYLILAKQPLLINCPCSSNWAYGPYKRHTLEFDQRCWRMGWVTAPKQPALSLTCSKIRSIILPIFYSRNAFRAHYCHEVSDLDSVIRWLERIGRCNRELLRDFCFWDWNPIYDSEMSDALRWLKRSDIFLKIGGSMETLRKKRLCCHRVTFGEEGDDYYQMVPWLYGEQVDICR